MVEIRVLGPNQKEVEAWFRQVFALVQEQAGSQEVRWRSVAEGRESDYLGYIRIGQTLPAKVAATPRLPRKGQMSAGRRRRANG